MTDRISMTRHLSQLRGALFAATLLVAGLAAPGEVLAQNNRASIGGGTCPTMGAVPTNMTLDQLIAACPPVSCSNLRTVSSLRASVGPAPEESQAAGIVADEQCAPTGGGAVSNPPDEPPRPPSNPISPPAIQSSRVIIERGYTQPNPGVDRSICKPSYRAEGTITNGQIVFTSGGHTWRGQIYPNSYISIDRNGVTPRPQNPTAITGPSDNAVMYNGYCGRGFFRVIPAGSPPPPLLVIPNGTYSGVRGWTDAGRKSPNKECLGNYQFDVTVRNGSIVFRSDNRTWRGSIDQSSGHVNIDGANANPRTNSAFRITGDARSANQYSAYCGNGYFHIDY